MIQPDSIHNGTSLGINILGAQTPPQGSWTITDTPRNRYLTAHVNVKWSPLWEFRGKWWNQEIIR